MAIYCLIVLAYRVISKLVFDKQVREQAYLLWEQRGRPNGDDWQDWFTAETMLTHSPPIP